MLLRATNMSTLASIQPLVLLIRLGFLLAGSILLWIGGRFLAKLPKATFLRSILAYILILISSFVILIFCIVIVCATDPNVELRLMPVAHNLFAVLASWCIIKLLFKASWPRTILAWLPTLIILAVSLLAPNIGQPPSQPVALELSHETTRILGPLNPDGTVNYLAAINAKYSEGITPENNGAVFLLQALGPDILAETVRDQILARLDMPQLAAHDDYFIPFEEYQEAHRAQDNTGESSETQKPSPEHEAIIERLLQGKTLSAQEIEDLLPAKPPTANVLPSPPPWLLEPEKSPPEKATEAPWSAKDYPLVAEWLEANEKPLALIMAASQRPRYYIPMLSPDDPAQVISGIIPAVQRVRLPAEALLARAMLKVSSGDIDAAFADLLVIHRLARLIGQSPTIIERLVACAIEKMACKADVALAVSGQLTAVQAQEYLLNLQALPALPSMTESFDVSERFTALDVGMLCFRMGYENALGVPVHAENHKLLPVGPESCIDGNEILRKANLWYDHLADASRKSTYAERRSAFTQVYAEADDIVKDMGDESKGLSLVKNILLSAIGDSEVIQARMTDAISKLFFALMIPAVSRTTVEYDLINMRLGVTQVALALAAYKAENVCFPQNLSELCPKYFETVPVNLFTGQALDYQATENGYKLSCPGPYHIHEFDDIVIEVPVPIVEEEPALPLIRPKPRRNQSRLRKR